MLMMMTFLWKYTKGEKKMILYHGSDNKVLTPVYEFNNSKRDYGAGFYTTLDYEPACEYAVCTSEGNNGYVHKYELNTTDLSIIDMTKVYDTLEWLAVLSKNRIFGNGRKYKVMNKQLIDLYYNSDIENYDIIVGYRADNSLCSIIKETLRDGVGLRAFNKIFNADILEKEVLIQSERAIKQLKEIETHEIEYEKYYEIYCNKDRKIMSIVQDLMNDDINDISDTLWKHLF